MFIKASEKVGNEEKVERMCMTKKNVSIDSSRHNSDKKSLFYVKHICLVTDILEGSEKLLLFST